MRPLTEQEQGRADRNAEELADRARQARLHKAAVERRKKRKRGGKK